MDSRPFAGSDSKQVFWQPTFNQNIIERGYLPNTSQVSEDIGI
jgi:hypothetical protein